MSRRFTVLARLSCQLEVSEPMKMGSVSIGQLPDELNYNLGSRRLHSTSQEPRAYSLVIQAQEVEFETSTFYWTDVSAHHGDEAIHKVSQSVDPLVRAVISEATGLGVSSQLLIAIGEDETEPSAYSHPMVARYSHAVIPDTARMKSLYRTLESDEKLRAACRHLAAAQIAADAGITGGEVAANAALLEYAKCLELLAKDLRLAVAPDVEAQRAALGVLREGLLAGSHDSQLAAVKAAAKTLQAIAEPTMKDRVRNLAKVLGLEAEWTAAALELISRRNSLAHPSVRSRNEAPGAEEAVSPHQVVVRAISAFAAHRSAQPYPPHVTPAVGTIRYRLWWDEPEGTIRDQMNLEAARRAAAADGRDPAAVRG